MIEAAVLFVIFACWTAAAFKVGESRIRAVFEEKLRVKDFEVAAERLGREAAEGRLAEYVKDSEGEAARERVDNENAEAIGGHLANPDDDAGFDGVLRLASADADGPAGPPVDPATLGPGSGEHEGHGDLEGAA